MPEELATGFQESVRPWTTADPASSGTGYALESLYYDTAGLRCYWEKVDGIRFRRKVRIRRYVDGPADQDSTVYLEIKQRADRVTQKRRTPTTLGRALAICERGRRPPTCCDDAEPDPVVDEVVTMFAGQGFQPTVVTGYHRRAVIGLENDPGLRITFDRGSYFRSAVPRMDVDGADGELLPPGWVIIEIKVNDRLPSWLSDVVARHGLSVTRISKYVQAVERAGLARESAFHHNPETKSQEE